jgi:chemotaxis protein MotB
MRWSALLLMLSVGCVVPKKKFDTLATDFDAHRAASADAIAKRDLLIDAHRKEIEQRRGKAQSLEEALTKAVAQNGELSTQISELQRQIDELTTEKSSLIRDRSQLKTSVAEMQEALKDLAERKAATEQRIAQYKDLLARFRSLIDAGRLRVKIANGRMIVELATDILFASGKAELSPDGKAAIKEVAGVLSAIPDRHFQVEGHTDNIPISNEKFPSNWELAAARAIVVTKALVDGGVSSGRLSGASYADARPVADNTSPEGRSANRRIEIVVVPDLSQLPGFEALNDLSK